MWVVKYWWPSVICMWQLSFEGQRSQEVVCVEPSIVPMFTLGGAMGSLKRVGSAESLLSRNSRNRPRASRLPPLPVHGQRISMYQSEIPMCVSHHQETRILGRVGRIAVWFVHGNHFKKKLGARISCFNFKNEEQVLRPIKTNCFMNLNSKLFWCESFIILWFISW